MQFYESSFKTEALTLNFRRAKALLEISMIILLFIVDIFPWKAFVAFIKFSK